MNRRVLVFFIVAVIFAGAALAASQGNFSGPRWQYAYVQGNVLGSDAHISIGAITMNGETISVTGVMVPVWEMLNGIGAEGWEYAGIFEDGYLFKRPY